MNRKITWAEIAKHNRYDDVWFVIEDGVYDPTEFIELHPGGPAMIQNRAGQDATRDFVDHGHSQTARAKLAKLQVGVLDPDSKPAEWQHGKKSQTAATYFSFAVIIFTFVYAAWALNRGPIV